MRKKIYWIEGDGIGPEIWRAARPVIDAALAKESDLRLDWQELLAGEKAVAETGSPLPGREPESMTDTTARPAPRVLWRAFKQGFLTNLLNPKAVLIFLTFLPQFMNPHMPLVPQFLELGGIMSLLCLLWYVSLAYILGQVRRAFENPRFQQWLHRCTGVVFIAFGLKLAASHAD